MKTWQERAIELLEIRDDVCTDEWPHPNSKKALRWFANVIPNLFEVLYLSSKDSSEKDDKIHKLNDEINRLNLVMEQAIDCGTLYEDDGQIVNTLGMESRDGRKYPELFAHLFEKEMNITSDEWIQRDEFKSEGMVIVDADGWDRHNFQFSFYEEKIDREEFLKRYMMSSIAPKGSGYQCVSDLWRPKTETSIGGQEYLN